MSPIPIPIDGSARLSIKRGALLHRIKHLEALRDDTLPYADMHAELWGRNKRQRPEGEPQKPDMMTKHKSGGRRKR